MTSDPILREVYKAKDKLAKQYGGDAHKLFEHLRELAKEHPELVITYLKGMIKVGRWANEHKHTEFDFMRGDEDYKYKFGGLNRHVMRVTVTK